MTRRVYFATSNVHKFREVSLILSEFRIATERLEAKGAELQSSDLREVAGFSGAGAARSYERPVLVEDAGLFIDSLGGFPGPYSSFVFRTLGLEGVLKLLRGVTKREAVFRSAAAYCKVNSPPRVFLGSIRGAIARRPAGDGGFGFDPIFVPEEKSKTFAEMEPYEKSRISHRGHAMRRFGRWYVQI